MSNFTFLPQEFQSIAEAATKAEGHIKTDPRAASFQARFTLEAILHWLYRHDPSLTPPYAQTLGALLHEPCLQNLLPQAVFHKARAIQKGGNKAVHDARPVRPYDALHLVKELHHICYWLLRSYSPATTPQTSWQDNLVPAALNQELVPRKDLEKLEKQLAEQHAATFKQQQEQDALDSEVQQLRQELAQIRANSQQQEDQHDYSEAETRAYLIDLELQRAGWPLDQERDREYKVRGMPSKNGIGYADYVLWGDDGRPLAVVEAKRSSLDPARGQQQANLYADCLENMHGQRPLIFC
ncbi:MAG: DUF4145 domain-containing protein, partial [Candidatus Electrothrix sp. AR3]|nr:DUF4145 domain-containing protein [Candidatus Electrothrix sp. AR3]